MTDYVATRWYRAPELLLSWKEHSASVDIWSVGCILAEMLNRKPFLTGADSISHYKKAKNQLELIVELMGTPSLEEICNIPKEKSRNFMKNLKKMPGKDLNIIFKDQNPDAIDLLKKMLVFDPKKRITVEEAVRHPYFKDLHSDADEPKAKPVRYQDFEFEDKNLTLQQYKDLIYEEILLYHFPDFKAQYKQNIKGGKSVQAHVFVNENGKFSDQDDSDEDYFDSDEDFSN